MFSFFHERKREVTIIQKAVADKQLHERNMMETGKLRAVDGECIAKKQKTDMKSLRGKHISEANEKYG